MGYFEKTEDLLWKDECQPLENEQMDDIKSQFHPSNTANVNIVPYEIYDTDEHIVGEWRRTIDGVKKKKPVYKKVVDFGALPSDTTKNVQHGIDDVEDFVRIQCMMVHTNGYSTELIISDSSVSNQTAVGADKSKCYIGTKSTSFTVYSAKFTLRYTKTTDEWQTV